MLLDNMTAEETLKEALPALWQIYKSARNINRRLCSKPMKEQQTSEIHSIQKQGTKYYYILNRWRHTRNFGEYRIVAVFCILRHHEDGRKYFLRFRWLDTKDPIFQTYEFHFIKRYAERKQSSDIRWTDEDFIKAFKDFINDGFDDPSTIYLYEKNEGEFEYEFFEKSSAGLLLGQYYDWPKSALIKYKTFVCGEQAKEFQRKYVDTIVIDSWINKSLGNITNRLSVVNKLDENHVRYL